MALSNSELAKNRSFPAAASLLSCPQCNYVSNLAELDSPLVPCPKCKNQGVMRRIFPFGSGRKLLEMVAYFYAKAFDRVEDLKAKLVRELHEKVDQIYDEKIAIGAANELQEYYDKNKNEEESQAVYEQMLKIIRKHLSLQSNEEAQKVFYTLFSYSETFEEHKVVVILTCTLLENLLKELLVLIHTCGGMDHSEARKKVDELRGGLGRLCKDFKEATGLSLKEVIDQSSIPDFSSDWETIRQARNNFIHGQPYAIGVSETEKAFNLAKNAFSLFAYLQNRFCVK